MIWTHIFSGLPFAMNIINSIFFNLHGSYVRWGFNFPILRLKKLSLREIKWLAWCCLGGKGQSWDLHSGLVGLLQFQNNILPLF